MSEYVTDEIKKAIAEAGDIMDGWIAIDSGKPTAASLPMMTAFMLSASNLAASNRVASAINRLADLIELRESIHLSEEG